MTDPISCKLKQTYLNVMSESVYTGLLFIQGIFALVTLYGAWRVLPSFLETLRMFTAFQLSPVLFDGISFFMYFIAYLMLAGGPYRAFIQPRKDRFMNNIRLRLFKWDPHDVARLNVIRDIQEYAYDLEHNFLMQNEADYRDNRATIRSLLYALYPEDEKHVWKY